MDANVTELIAATVVAGTWMVAAGVSKRTLLWRRSDVCRRCGRPRSGCSCPVSRRPHPPRADGAG